VWNLLSTEDQSAWGKLSDKGKTAIMFAFKSTDAKKEVPKVKHKINQTIIEEEEEFSDAIETSPIGDIEYLIQAATMKNPADICNILSSPKKQKPQEKRTNQHMKRYDVSRHSRNVFKSLVDRRANGGIASSE